MGVSAHIRKTTILCTGPYCTKPYHGKPLNCTKPVGCKPNCNPLFSCKSLFGCKPDGAKLCCANQTHCIGLFSYKKPLFDCSFICLPDYGRIPFSYASTCILDCTKPFYKAMFNAKPYGAKPWCTKLPYCTEP